MPDDLDSSRSAVGEMDEEEEGSDDFFDAGEGAVIGGRGVSSRAESESGQSGGGTEDDPVGPVTPSAAPTMVDGGTISRKPNAVNFSRTISADSADSNDLDDDEEWVDPTPIPPTPLETVPPAFPPPPVIAKTKSSSSAKSRKRKEARAPVPFPSSATEGGPEDRPRRVPQMSTARGRDGGRTQSGGVKGVIAPDPGPAEPDDVDDF